jgi:hypothetical protein
MLDAKLIADLITLSRGLFGLGLVWLGLSHSLTTVPVAVVLMILGWTSDFIDGSIAHLSRHPRQTWIGDRDLQVDVFVSLCLGVYLIATGFVGWIVGLFYLIVWGLIFWRFGSDRNLLMLFQSFIYLKLIFVAFNQAPMYGYLILIWVALATAINWKRFTQRIVPGFVGGMKSLRGGHGGPRNT